jgi:hypothetical protein
MFLLTISGLPLLFLKGLVALSFAAIFVLLAMIIVKGRRVRQGLEKSDRHRKLGKATFWITLAAIVLTEVMVRTAGGAHANSLFVVHLLFSLPFFVSLLLMNFRITGLRNAKSHRWLGYLNAFFFLGTLATGAPLLYQL